MFTGGLDFSDIPFLGIYEEFYLRFLVYLFALTFLFLVVIVLGTIHKLCRQERGE